jgi:hypothetical protein
MHEIGYCPALARLPDGRLIGCMLHGGNMVIDGDDLHVLMRTADAKNAHNSNLITFHTVRDFRELVY